MDDFLISGDILVAYKGNLPEVVIPDGVRVIAEEAFRNHTELKKYICLRVSWILEMTLSRRG